MGDIPTYIVLAAVLGLIAGAVVVLLGFSALRAFILLYPVALVVVMLLFVWKAPAVVALLATLTIALYSFIPATGGFVAGAWLARVSRKQNSETSQKAR